MSSHDEPTRITVSRDALRADLAEMELRLRLYFDERLSTKADAVTQVRLESQMADLRRGEFTDAFRRSVVSIVEDAQEELTDRGWTRRERMIGVIAMVLAVVSFAFTVYVSTSSASSLPSETPTEKGASDAG